MGIVDSNLAMNVGVATMALLIEANIEATVREWFNSQGSIFKSMTEQVQVMEPGNFLSHLSPQYLSFAE